MRKFLHRLIALVTLAFVLAATAAHAGTDEQWPLPNTPELGHHSIIIEDSIDFFKLFSFIETSEAIPGKTVSCASLDAPGCKGASNFHVNAGFTICETSKDADCIETLRFVTEAGEVVDAEFVQFAYSEHPNMFTGDGKLLAPKIGLPSIWRASKAGHEAGSLYLVVAGIKGGVHKSAGGWRNMEMYASIFPISEFMEPRFAVQPGSFAFPHCNYKLDKDQIRVQAGCAGSAADFGYVRCVAFKQDGTCLLRHAHNLDQKIELGVRLLKPASGWFHGRVVDPSIEIDSSSGFSRVTVSANPVRVPTFFMGSLYSEMGADEKRYWDQCLARGECNSSTRLDGSDPGSQRDGNLRNVQAYEDPVGQRALEIIARFADRVEDKSIAAPTNWSIRTLGTVGEGDIFKCTSQVDGVVAMISTNATAYSDGPPSINSGLLTYQVAGLHLGPAGDLNLGTYDLVLRSDVARCLYGFNQAPISATVQVVGEMGKENIATTIVSEKDGWLKLAAYGFTFSEKEIQVKLTQPFNKTLTKFTGTTKALSSKQKAEVKATVTKAKGNPKFICTGVYVKATSKATALARARAACNYAKSLDKNHSYYAQAKQTTAKSYDAKVMLVSK